MPQPLRASLHKFLVTLSDPDLTVRRGAVLAMNCIAHNCPLALRENLPELLPMLYSATCKKPELVHQVVIPPHNHTSTHSHPHLHRPARLHLVPLAMGIPILLSRSGFTAWGVEIAKSVGLTMVGRLRGERFLCLTGSKNLIFDEK